MNTNGYHKSLHSGKKVIDTKDSACYLRGGAEMDYVDVAYELRHCSSDKRHSKYVQELLKTGAQALLDCNAERKRLKDELKELKRSLQIIKDFMEV